MGVVCVSECGCQYLLCITVRNIVLLSHQKCCETLPLRAHSSQCDVHSNQYKTLHRCTQHYTVNMYHNIIIQKKWKCYGNNNTQDLIVNLLRSWVYIIIAS